MFQQQLDPENGHTSKNNKIQSSPLLCTLPTSSSSLTHYLFSDKPQKVKQVLPSKKSQKVQKVELVEETQEELNKVFEQSPSEPTLINIHQFLNTGNNKAFFKARLMNIATSIESELTVGSQITISNIILRSYATPSQLFTELCQKQFPTDTDPQYEFNMIQIIQLIPQLYPNINFGDNVDLFNEITSAMVQMNPTIQLSSFKPYFNIDPELFKHLISINVKRIIPDFDPKTITETIYMHYTDPELLLSQLFKQHGVSKEILKPLFKQIYPKKLNESAEKVVDDFIANIPAHEVVMENVEQFKTEFDVTNNAFVAICTHKSYPIDKILCATNSFTEFPKKSVGAQCAYFKDLFDFKGLDSVIIDQLVDVICRPNIPNMNWFGRGANTITTLTIAPQHYQFITPQSAFIYTSLYTIIQIFAALHLKRYDIPNLLPNEDDNNNNNNNHNNENITYTTAQAYINDIPHNQMAHLKLLLLMSGALSPNNSERETHEGVFKRIYEVKKDTNNYQFVQLFSKVLCFSLVGTAGFGKTEIFNLLTMLCFYHRLPLTIFNSSTEIEDSIITYDYPQHSVTRTSHSIPRPETTLQSTNSQDQKTEHEPNPTPSLDSIDHFKKMITSPTVVLYEPRESKLSQAFRLQGKFITQRLFPTLQQSNTLFISMHSQPLLANSTFPSPPKGYLADEFRSSPFTYLHFIHHNYHQVLQQLFSKLFTTLLSSPTNASFAPNHLQRFEDARNLLKECTRFCNASLRGYIQFLQSNPIEFAKGFYQSRIISNLNQNPQSRHFHDVLPQNPATIDSDGHFFQTVKDVITHNISHFSTLYGDAQNISPFISELYSTPNDPKYSAEMKEKLFYSLLLVSKSIRFDTTLTKDSSHKFQDVPIHQIVSLPYGDHSSSQQEYFDSVTNISQYIRSLSRHIDIRPIQSPITPKEAITPTKPTKSTKSVVKDGKDEDVVSLQAKASQIVMDKIIADIQFRLSNDHISSPLISNTFPTNTAIIYICPPGFATFDHFTIYRHPAATDQVIIHGGQFSVSSQSNHDAKESGKPKLNYDDALAINIQCSTHYRELPDKPQNHELELKLGVGQFKMTCGSSTYYHQSSIYQLASESFQPNNCVSVLGFHHPLLITNLHTHLSNPHLYKLHVTRGDGSSSDGLIDYVNRNVISFTIDGAGTNKTCTVANEELSSNLLYKEILQKAILKKFNELVQNEKKDNNTNNNNNNNNNNKPLIAAKNKLTIGAKKVFTIKQNQGDPTKHHLGHSSTKHETIIWDWSAVLQPYR